MQQRALRAIKNIGFYLGFLALLIFFAHVVHAAATLLTAPPECNESVSGTGSGLVPCGKTVITTIVGGQPQYTLSCPCQLYHVGILFMNVYSFILKDLIFPLAGLMVVVGGILLILSGANPKWFDQGRNILIWTAVALGAALASWIMIDFVLKAIGYSGTWSILPF